MANLSDILIIDQLINEVFTACKSTMKLFIKTIIN